MRSFGSKQPRIDVGVVSLKLIVEVKLVRQPSGFKDVEEEIPGDLGLYFADAARWEHLLVYVYDCNTYAPELNDSLPTALMARDPRVKDVAVVRRLSMTSGRSSRA